MANYASLRGPVGLNRVFLDTGGLLDPEAARVALKEGRSFASNGPLLGLEIGGARPGDRLQGDGAGATAGSPGTRHFKVAMRSPVAVDHLEIVQNGKVLRAFTLPGDRRSFDGGGELAVEGDGWILLRAWNDHADPLVLDIYPYATTSPVYVEGFGPRPDARNDAAYFVTWLDRTIDETRARSGDYNDDREKRSTLDYLARARAAYAALAAGNGR